MRKYDVVLLDAQGTLLRAHPSVPAIYADVCRRSGAVVSHREVGEAVRELWTEFRRSREGQTAACDTSDEATREWWAAFNTSVFHRLGMRENLDRFLEELWEVFGQARNWRLYPEVQEVLTELRRRGYRLGVVSNWDSRLVSICESLGLAAHMDFILASAAAGMEKPDRRIFEIALARAAVPPRRAIHVGDDYEADVLGARGAGVDAVLVDRDGTSLTDGPTIRSLVELLRILT